MHLSHPGSAGTTRALLAAGLSLALAAATFSTAPAASGAEDDAGPGGASFSSSFEASDPAVLVSTPYSAPERVSGNQFAPGSLLGSVRSVSASGENPPAEVASAAADATPGTKWLVRSSTAWLRYDLDGATKVARYALTSANDASGRDPQSWKVEGSTNGTDWTTVDSQDGVTFDSRLQTKTFTVANPGSFSAYRLTITANRGDSLTQLADWEIFDASDGEPQVSPMLTAPGSGPTAGPTIRPGVGFTGLRALRYSGTQTSDGDASSSNVLYDDLDLTVADGMELAYKVFPVLDESDLTYPATYVAVDLVLGDGSTRHLMSDDADLTDQYGFGVSAAAQGKEKALYGNQWNAVRVDLSPLAGQHVTGILLTYDHPGGTAGTAFSGWVDDVALRQAAQVDSSSLTNYVDTRRGTNASSSFSRGNNIPATAVPNGFNFYTPMTDAGSQTWLYSYAAQNDAKNRPTLNGIGISHEPSPWMGDRDQLAVMPSASTASTPSADLKDRALPFSHDNEVARPDLYQVTFDDGIVTKVAPSDHAAIYSFTFPAGVDVGTLLVDQVQGSSSFVRSGTTLTGWVEGGSGLSAGASRMFFSAELSATPTRDVPAAGRTSALAVQFDTSRDRTVEMRIATSFISVAQARKNLDEEVAQKSFDEVQRQAAALWEARLKVIDVPDATPAQRQTLYSNLYRLNLYPNSQFEHTGEGSADGYQYASPVSEKVSSNATATTTNAKVVDGKIYVNNGFWDTYRTVWPAYSLLYPDVAKELVDGFVQQYRDGGWIARWSSPGYADLMTGTSSDASFAEAYATGAVPTDLALEAYDAALKNATVLPTSSNVGRKGLDTSPFLGYTSTATGESVSWGLEGYINDYALGQMAARLAADPAVPADRVEGLQESSAYLLQRAKDYVNMFDPAVGFFQGKTPEGSFARSASTFDPASWGGDYTETNGWNFAFHTPYDVAGLAALYGGTDGLVAKLDEFFRTQEKGTYGIHEAKEARDVRMGQFGMSNQVSHHIPYIYAAAGKPAGTQKTVREVLQRLFVGSEIGQGYPGDEDNGEMSSWYLLSSLGFYPLSLASGQYTVGSPLFDKVVVDRGSHGTITVEAPGNSKDTVYVSSLKLDGRDVSTPTIEQSTLLDGKDHTLTFGMTDHATTWGTDGAQAQERTPYVDAAKPGFGTVAADDDTDLSLLVDDNSRTSVTLPAARTAVTWTSTSGPVAVASYTLTNAAAGTDGRLAPAPSSWRLQASNDGEEWTTLDERHGESFAWATQTRAFEVREPALYTRYRILVEGTSTGAPARLAEVELLDDTLRQSSELAIYPSATVQAAVGSPVRAVLATAKGAGNDASDYTATVDFLDGSGAQQATVARSSLGGVQVTAPHTYDLPGLYTVRVTLTALVDDQPATVSGLAQVAVGRDQTLEGSFDSACLTEVGTAVTCDGNGFSLTRSKLAAAGFTQGEPVTVDGDVQFVPPVTKVGKPDNVMALGQKIRLDLGEGASALSVIGFATEKTLTGTATITYADGSTQDISLSFGDWVGAAGAPVDGGTALATVKGRQSGANGSDTLRTAIFASKRYPLKAGTKAEWITLPDLKSTAKQGQMHIFGFASDGVPTEHAGLRVTPVDSVDQVAGTEATVRLAKISGGRPTAAGYAATVNWGDETPVDRAVVDGATVTAAHTYAAPGTYTVTVTADDGTTSSSATTTITVDPSVYETAVQVGPTTVAPGATVTVDGSGFAKNEQVVVELASDPKVTRTVTASAQGAFQVDVVVPRPQLDGTYPITALGARSNTVAETSVEVVNPLVTTKLSLAASPTTAQVGAPVTLTARLTPDGGGAVEFFDGRTSLGLVSVVGGSARLVVDDLGVGRHTLRASYAGDASHRPAASGSVSVQVVRVTPKVSAPKLSRSSTVYGSSTPVTISSTVSGVRTGTVTFTSGSKVLGRAAIGRSGSGYGASVQLARRLPAGTYAHIRATVARTATNVAVTSAEATKALKVAKAKPGRVTVSGKAFVKNTRPTVKVTVGRLDNGSFPVGKVTVRVAGREVRTVTLTAAAHGKVTVTLPRASASIKVKATFTPSDRNVTSRSSTTVTLKATARARR